MKDEFGEEYTTPMPLPCSECGSVRPHFVPGGYCLKVIKAQLASTAAALRMAREALFTAGMDIPNGRYDHAVETIAAALAAIDALKEGKQPE